MPGFYETEDMRIAAYCMESLEDDLATGLQLYIAVPQGASCPQDLWLRSEYPRFSKSVSCPCFF
jgi:hypothetical protein